MSYITCCGIHFNTGCKLHIFSDWSISSQLMMSHYYSLNWWHCLVSPSPCFMMGWKNGAVARKEVMISVYFCKFPGIYLFLLSKLCVCVRTHMFICISRTLGFNFPKYRWAWASASLASTCSGLAHDSKHIDFSFLSLKIFVAHWALGNWSSLT